MATVSASSILSKASILLHDTAKTRWSDTELLGWLNLGQRAIVTERPEAYAMTLDVGLEAGTRQSVPANAVRLLKVVRNTAGRAVTLANPEMLDAEDPDWHAGTTSATVIHYVYDQHDPHVYYVYPPNTGTGHVEIVVSAAPPDVVSAGDVISVDDIYADALLNYVLYRALAKDSGSTANLNRATLAYRAFTAALTSKVKGDTISNPNINTTPTQDVPPEAKLS